MQKIAQDDDQTLDLPADKYDFPSATPLKFMGKWLNISKIRASPLEQDIADYR